MRYLGFGDDTVTPPEPPSRAVWFLLGLASAFVGAPLFEIFGAGSRRLARRIEPKKAVAGYRPRRRAR